MKSVFSGKSFYGLFAVLILYTITALFRLGTSESPQTRWESNEIGTEIVLDLGEQKDVAALVYYLGNYGRRVFSLETASGDPIMWETHEDIRMPQPYQWRAVQVSTRAQYLKLTTKNVYTQLNELLIIDRNGDQLLPVNAADYPELFDESALYKGKSTYETGTVFDESVYARTAYEFLNGMRAYEDTHPPMGKTLISTGIALFGMNPFGWRFAGAVSGILMLVMLWAFAKKMFQNPWISVLITIVFAFDFMHFSHTRLAQIDSFLVLFMMGMYYFMYLYGEVLAAGAYAANRRKVLCYMLLSGICLGLAIACKWSGGYGMLGLFGLWFAYTASACWRRYLTGRNVAELHLCFCFMFLLVPAVIYVLAYIPYVPIDSELGYFEALIQNQVNMFQYHTGLTETNPESAKWFQWPLIAVPITYCSLVSKGMQESVFLFGNPAFWLPGIGAFFYCVYDVWNTKNRKAVFLLIMYLSPMLPWILVPRSSFIYHYFPSLPAMALMLGLFGDRLGDKGERILGILAFASVVLFMIFYPIISGLSVPVEYVSWLEWLPWWDF